MHSKIPFLSKKIWFCLPSATVLPLISFSSVPLLFYIPLKYLYFLHLLQSFSILCCLLSLLSHGLWLFYIYLHVLYWQFPFKNVIVGLQLPLKLYQNDHFINIANLSLQSFLSSVTCFISPHFYPRVSVAILTFSSKSLSDIFFPLL